MEHFILILFNLIRNLHIFPQSGLTIIYLSDNFLIKPTFKVTELIWEDDVQLISQFLEMKVILVIILII